MMCISFWNSFHPQSEWNVLYAHFFFSEALHADFVSKYKTFRAKQNTFSFFSECGIQWTNIFSVSHAGANKCLNFIHKGNPNCKYSKWTEVSTRLFLNFFTQSTVHDTKNNTKILQCTWTNLLECKYIQRNRK